MFVIHEVCNTPFTIPMLMPQTPDMRRTWQADSNPATPPALHARGNCLGPFKKETTVYPMDEVSRGYYYPPSHRPVIRAHRIIGCA